jgi:hypothetical protein
MAFTFLDPRQGPKSGLVDPARRVTTLSGKRVGILWNNRPRGDALLRSVAEALNQKYGLEEVYFTKKTFIGNAAPAELIEELAARVDVAIVGVGD